MQKKGTCSSFPIYRGEGGFRSRLLADAGWSERRRRPVNEVLERRASDGPTDGELATDLSSPEKISDFDRGFERRQLR